MRRIRSLLVALLAGLLVILTSTRPAGAQASGARVVYLAFPRGQPAWLLPVRVLLVEGVSPYRDVLDLLCRGPRAGDGTVGSALPRGTRVERLSVAAGTATVDLELGRPEPRGRAAKLAAQAVAHTLCQFADVQRVVLRVGGRPWPGTGAGEQEAVTPDPSVLFSGFPDLKADSRAGPVLALTVRGVFSGYPDGTFRPSEAVSRAEAVKSLVEALSGQPPVGAVTAAPEAAWFADVPRGHWVLPYLRLAIRKGIVPEPRRGEQFRPGDDLDGPTLVEWCYRAAGPHAGDRPPGRVGAGAGEVPRMPSREEAESWLVSHRILTEREGSWSGVKAISRAEWAAVLARILGLGGPDLYLATPLDHESLEGEVVAVGAARWPEGVVTVGVLDSRGRELASRRAVLHRSEGDGGWGWFAEWLHFPRPLASSAGIVRVTHQPPEGEGGAGIQLPIPVFIR